VALQQHLCHGRRNAEITVNLKWRGDIEQIGINPAPALGGFKCPAYEPPCIIAVTKPCPQFSLVGQGSADAPGADCYVGQIAAHVQRFAGSLRQFGCRGW
jgi:hypothetical protein